jgi:hypothetical protein
MHLLARLDPLVQRPSIIGRFGAAGVPLPLDFELPPFHEPLSLSLLDVYALAPPLGDRHLLGALVL